MCYTEAVLVNQGVYDVLVFVNHCALYCTKGCESICVKLSLWLCIMVCYAELVVANHGV